jgi:hypothetical protein
MTSARDGRAAEGAGVGLRLPHLQEVVRTLPPARWLEIHPENFLANPHGTELLLEARRTYPISVHTVGVSIGSAGGIDRVHLSRVRALVNRLDPCLVSGHLAWSTYQGEYLSRACARCLTPKHPTISGSCWAGTTWSNYTDRGGTSLMAHGSSPLQRQ